MILPLKLISQLNFWICWAFHISGLSKRIVFIALQRCHVSIIFNLFYSFIYLFIYCIKASHHPTVNCLSNSLFSLSKKKSLNSILQGFCVAINWFLSQRTSNLESVSMSLCLHIWSHLHLLYILAEPICFRCGICSNMFLVFVSTQLKLLMNKILF